MARAIQHADDQLVRAHTLGGGDRLDVFCRALVEADDAFGIARPHGQLVHIDIGRVQEVAFFGDRQHGQRVLTSLGGDCRAFERIKRDVDLGALADGTADLFADKQHRRLVALALADDHGAVHVQLIERGAHRFDSGGIGCLFIATTDKAGGGDGGRLGYADHFENENAVKKLAAGRDAHKVAVLG